VYIFLLKNRLQRALISFEVNSVPLAGLFRDMNSMRPIHKRVVAMTLIELTVVILVLLTLVTLIFIGATAWKKGSDRGTSVLNIRNAQTAGRSYQNMYNESSGKPLSLVDGVPAEIVGTGNFLELPPAPSGDGEQYIWADKIPRVGNAKDDYEGLFMNTTFDGSDGLPDHRPTDVQGW